LFLTNQEQNNLQIHRVIDLLATPEKWCKATLRTIDGRHCIRGALLEADGLGTLGPIVLRAINEVTGRHYRSIEAFNAIPIRITHRSSRCWRALARTWP
jgi:hypothetical protein